MKSEKNQIQTKLDTYLEGLTEPPKTFKRGEIITGNIVKILKGEILVDVGGRAEGVVSGRETKL
ncbi:MAG TPA: 30S ribosomal protein S1, partial [Candidatus Dojkabacteria bacterium]|nr:30S ribosomal protein S1 [Candidatus Dojkabacteria bacterium]